MTANPKAGGVIPTLRRDDIRLLWHADFWDGPINGLCLYGGEKYWFELCTEDGPPETPGQRFLVVRLSPDQLAEEERWHALFREKVGTHTDYDEPRPAVHPPDRHGEFYDAYHHRPKPDYSNNPVVGRFDLD